LKLFTPLSKEGIDQDKKVEIDKTHSVILNLKHLSW
jgi:hypothetical protein